MDKVNVLGLCIRKLHFKWRESSINEISFMLGGIPESLPIKYKCTIGKPNREGQADLILRRLEIERDLSSFRGFSVEKGSR